MTSHESVACALVHGRHRAVGRRFTRPVGRDPERRPLPRSKTLLRSGADVNAADSDGTTALMHAVIESDVRMMKLLVAERRSCQREKRARFDRADVRRDRCRENRSPAGCRSGRARQRERRRHTDECRGYEIWLDPRAETSVGQRRRAPGPADGGCGAERRSRSDAVLAGYWREPRRREQRDALCRGARTLRRLCAAASGERRSRQRRSREWRRRPERNGQESDARTLPIAVRSRGVARDQGPRRFHALDASRAVDGSRSGSRPHGEMAPVTGRRSKRHQRSR